MATEFLMPKLGLTMEAGTIIEWLAEDGDAVAAGDAVLRIETDKVESDVELVGDGLLHRVGEVGEMERGTEFLCERFARRAVAAVDDDMGAFGDTGFRRRLPDARRAPGDEDRFVFEAHRGTGSGFEDGHGTAKPRALFRRSGAATTRHRRRPF